MLQDESGEWIWLSPLTPSWRRGKLGWLAIISQGLAILAQLFQCFLSWSLSREVQHPGSGAGSWAGPWTVGCFPELALVGCGVFILVWRWAWAIQSLGPDHTSGLSQATGPTGRSVFSYVNPHV